MLPALPGLGQRGFQLGQLFGLDAHAVVADADIEQPLIPQRVDADAHHAALFLGRDAVLEGILHNGLQDEGRHHRLRQIEGVGDAPHHLHTVAEADVINRVILVHDAHFPGQRHLLVVAHQAVAQQVRQSRDEGLRAVGFFLSGGL